MQREAAVEEEEESDEEEALSFEELRRRKLDAFKSPEKSKHRAHRSPSTGPSRPFRVSVCAARTLNVKGQSRVTLSLQ